MSGYVVCRSCGTRIKAGREFCLKCFEPLPHPDEQRAIAAVLSDMDAEQAALEQRRDKTRALKQAMIQELLTGKTRLVPAGNAHA